MGILLESSETGTNNPKTFCILLPSNGCGMLLKCVANSDVLLPLSSSLCIQNESDEIEREVESLLLEVSKKIVRQNKLAREYFFSKNFIQHHFEKYDEII